MRKGFLILLASVITFGLQAQKLNVNNAIEALKDNEIGKAKTYIDRAVADASTKTNGKAWLIRAFVYHAIGMDKADMMNDKKQIIPFVASINGKGYPIDLDKAKSARPTTKEPLKNALKSYNRYIVYSKKPNRDLAAAAISSLVLKAYKDGFKYYKSDKSDQAMASFALLDRALNLEKGKFYPSLTGPAAQYKSQLLKLRGSALRAKASMAYQKGDDKVTMPILQECLKSPSSSSGQIYVMAAQIYKNQKNDAKYLSTIKEGLKKFPDHQGLKDEELHHFVASGNPLEAIGKLEASIAKDPKNHVLIFNLGKKYAEMSKIEKDATKKKEYFSKSITNYTKAVELDPTISDYQFNLGGMYYNRGVTLSKELGKLGLDETAKYDAMTKLRDADITTAISKFETLKATLEKGNLKNEMTLNTYKQVVTALKGSYTIMRQSDKRKAMEAILEKY